jgi:acyl-CoA reductase-like NAD-dependent aldehyde dehydrogenase
MATFTVPATEHGFAATRAKDEHNVAETLDFSPLLSELNQTFRTGHTRSLNWRRRQLQSMVRGMKEMHEEITASVRADLGGAKLRGVGELSVIDEAEFALSHLDEWTAPIPARHVASAGGTGDDGGAVAADDSAVPCGERAQPQTRGPGLLSDHLSNHPTNPTKKLLAGSHTNPHARTLPLTHPSPHRCNNNNNNTLQVKNGFMENPAGSAEVVPSPKGTVLLISPWNYPIGLALKPLVAILAAGNCCVIKPSEVSAHCAVTIKTFVDKYLDPAAIRVILGGVVCNYDYAAAS